MRRHIRAGEVWSRPISKHLLHKNEAKDCQTVIDANQFGVSGSGGMEALIHTREAIETTIRGDSAIGVWVAVDVDFVNAFSTLFSRWCQHHCGDIILPCGDRRKALRGAE